MANEEETMSRVRNRTLVPIVALATAVLALAGCSNRALTGAAIGATGGAVVGYATGHSVLGGALIGGVGGAAVGALTDRRR
jgi:hypothetical protein